MPDDNTTTTPSGATPAAAAPSGPALSDYYNASQLRADSWSRLKTATAVLAERGGGAPSAGQLTGQIAELLALLAPIEGYWAFPGRQDFAELRRLLEAGDFAILARVVARIVRAMMSNAYRYKAIPLDLRGEPEDDDDEADEEISHARPYFEVLIVDKLMPAQEAALRHNLRRMRRDEDRFIYEPVVVPSFEDAIIAVAHNYNIQAVVARYGFPFRSQHNMALLHRYLSRLDDDALANLEPDQYGPQLARCIGQIRPELDVYLVTDRSVEDIAGHAADNCRRVFYNQEDYFELHLNILRGINSRWKTPFFSALREFSRQPTGVFHAMPISRGKSITKSHWIRDMVDFYGLNIFLAETSATSGGLDSLLEPTGPIKSAQAPGRKRRRPSSQKPGKPSMNVSTTGWNAWPRKRRGIRMTGIRPK